MSTTVTSTEVIKIAYDEATKSVIFEWLLSPTPEEYKAGLETLGNALIAHKTSKLVANVENAGAISEDLQHYTMHVWTPKITAVVGDFITAVVLEENIFSQLSIETMLEDEQNVSKTATFGNMKDALNWIAKQ